MPSKKPAAARRKGKTTKPANGVYTLVAPNPNFETDGVRVPHFYGKLRFIEGKSRVTDAHARTMTYKDGISTEEIPFASAEHLVRHFVGLMSSPGREWRVVPELSDLNDDARKVAPYFTRTIDGDDIRVELKADAPSWVHEMLERNPDVAPDSYNPNLGRSRRERIHRQQSAPLVAASPALIKARSQEQARQKETVAP